MNEVSVRIGSLLVLTLVLCSVQPLQAQMKGWEVGPWLGVSYYLGDLNTSYNLRHPNLAGGLATRYNFNERLAFRLSANVGTVEADDAESNNPFERTRNLSFRSRVIDGSLGFEFNFLPYEHGNEYKYFTPYLFGGISVFHFNPQAELNGEWYDLRPLGTEGQFRGQEYYSVTGAVNYGLGFKIDLSYEWSIDIALGARNTFTDYLDDVSTVYPDRSDLIRNRGELAAQFSDRSLLSPGNEGFDRESEQRGDSTNKDKYFFVGVGLNYYFGDIRCPDYGSRRRR